MHNVRMKVEFQDEIYELVITDHAQNRMIGRGITIEQVIDILKTGKALEKDKKNKFWVFKNIKGRKDNYICLSVALETPFLVVVTTLINWRPK
jgi:hypothetical protein